MDPTAQLFDVRDEQPSRKAILRLRNFYCLCVLTAGAIVLGATGVLR